MKGALKNTVKCYAKILRDDLKKVKSVYQGHVLSQMNAPVTFSILITLIINKSIFCTQMFLVSRGFFIWIFDIW